MPRTPLQPVPTTSRKVGDRVQVYDTFDTPRPTHEATIAKIDKKYVTLRTDTGFQERFHRATGFVVGYRWPHSTVAIAPETSKE